MLTKKALFELLKDTPDDGLIAVGNDGDLVLSEIVGVTPVMTDAAVVTPQAGPRYVYATPTADEKDPEDRAHAYQLVYTSLQDDLSDLQPRVVERRKVYCLRSTQRLYSWPDIMVARYTEETGGSFINLRIKDQLDYQAKLTRQVANERHASQADIQYWKDARDLAVRESDAVAQLPDSPSSADE